MSKEIDTKVVQMQFDNKQFEKGSKETLSTLEKLKQALQMKESSKGLENLDKAARSVSLDNIAKGVESLEKRFSTFGIVSMRVIQNITDSCMNLANRGIRYVNDAIVSGGIRRAQNLENAHFMLQALLKDEEKVQAVMDDANKSVDGTRYSLDEAAKTAAQFSASGIQAGDDMLNALRGVVGVASMTNSEFEGISQIFTAVSGQGRLMGDQLLQLAGRGLNAAAVIADFVNGVTDGSKEASDTVKEVVAEISDGAKVTEADIRELTSKGKISFRLFSEAMTEAFADSAERANETFSGALANMRAALARIGAGFVSPLIAQNNEVIGLFNALRLKINDVKKILVFDEAIGNVDALSKRFTDAVLAMAKGATEFVTNLDLTKPTEILVKSINSIINVAKGFYSVIKPIGNAFAEVFLDFSVSDVVDIASSIENLTSKMKLSEKGGKNLHDAMKGLFSVVKLVGDGFLGLVKAIIPVTKPVESVADLLLSFVGTIGRSLSSFTEWVSQSRIISTAYDVVASSIQNATNFISKLVDWISNLIKTIAGLEEVQYILNTICDIFEGMGDLASTAIEYVISSIVEFADVLKDAVPKALASVVITLANAFKFLGDKVNDIDFSSPAKMFETLTAKVNELFATITKNQGISSYIRNLKEYLENLKEAFTFDRMLDNIERAKTALQDFSSWLKDVISPIFEDFSAGGAIAGATGIGLGYGIVKAALALEGLTKSIKTIPDTLGSVRDALQAYQDNLKADSLKKVAAAILILAGALTVLSFADPERLRTVAVAISGIAAIIGTVMIKLAQSKKVVEQHGNPFAAALYSFSVALNNAMDQLVKALRIKFIGGAIKDFGIAIGLVVASIIGIAVMYKKDKTALTESVNIIKEIGYSLAGLMAAITVISDVGGSKTMEAFKNAAIALTAISGSVLIIVTALMKLFALTLPPDYTTKLVILGGIIVGLGTLATAMDIISKKWGGGKVDTKPLLAIAIAAYAIVSALIKLFNVELPYDWETKVGILVGIILALDTVILAIGRAGGSATTAIKATGPILAMCLFIPVVVGALGVLSLFPGEQLLKAAIALGAVLVALGGALYGAGQVTKPDTYKTVLAMVGIVASIAASLGVLSMIPIDKLAKAAATLGSMLILLATDLLAASKIQNDKAFLSVLAMIGVVVSIAGSLVILAGYPWEDLLASATAIGEVLLAMSVAFGVIGLAKPNEKAALMFLAGVVAVIGIAATIGGLAQYPADKLLASATAISEVLLAMTVAFGVASLAGAAAPAAIAGIALLDLFIANFALVLVALGAIFNDPATKNLLGGGASVLAQIGEAIGAFAGNIVGGFLGGVSDSFPKIGENLAAFMENAKPFVEGAKSIDGGVVDGVLKLAEVFAILTAVDLVSRLTAFINGGDVFSKFGDQLVAFGPKLKEFATTINGISGTDVEAAGSAALMLTNVAKNLPYNNPEWLTTWIGSRMTLSDFGEELVKFGPKLKVFAESIKGITSADVEGAAAAATMMAEFADKIPNSGGIIEEFFGNNDIDDFGEKLVSFGEDLAAFAEEVQDVTEAQVKGAAAAGTMMADLADKIPNSGGVLDTFFGNNDIDDFGEDLISFGEDLADFAEEVEGITKKSVEGAAAAGTMMADLAQKIPNDGGVIGFFAGNNNIGTFGDNIRTFGEGLADYSESVESINTTQLSKVTSEVGKLIDLSSRLNAFDPSGMTMFSYGLQQMAVEGIKKFIEAFETSTNKAKDTVEKFVEAAKEGLDKGTNPNEYQKIGEKLIDAFIDGINNKDNVLEKTVKDIAAKIPKIFSQNLSNNTLYKFGQDYILALGKGISDRSNSVITTIRTLCSNIATALSNNLTKDKASSIGNTFIESLAKGLTNGQSRAVGNIKIICSEILKALRAELHSTKANDIGEEFVEGLADGMDEKKSEPSDKMEGIIDDIMEVIDDELDEDAFRAIGENIPKGLAKGISNNESAAKSAAVTMANAILTAFNNTLTQRAFEDIGKNAATGLANGIESKVGEVNRKAARMATASADSAKKALDEHSPSKVFFEIGENASLGMANGINDATDSVKEAGENLADNAINPVIDSIDPLNDAITSITDVAKSGTDADFKINPNIEVGDSSQMVNSLDFVNAFDRTASKLGMSLSEFASDAMTLMGVNMPKEAFFRIGQDLALAFISGMNSRREYVLSTVKDFARAIVHEMDSTINADAFKSIGVTVINSFVKGINANNKETIPSIKKFYAYLHTVMQSNLKEEKFEDLGIYILEEFVNGMNDRSDKVNAPIKEFCDAIVDGMKTNLSKNALYEIVEDAMLAIIDGFDRHQDEAIGKATEFTTDLTNAVKDGIADNKKEALTELDEFIAEILTEFQEGLPKDEVVDLTTDFMDALTDTISNKSSEPVKVVSDLTKQINDTLSTELKSQSFKDIATDVMEGLIRGFDDKKDEAVEKANEVARAIKDAMRVGMANINKVVEVAGDNLNVSKFDVKFTRLVDGINNGVKHVTGSVEWMTKTIENGLKKNIQTVSTGIANSVNESMHKVDHIIEKMTEAFGKSINTVANKIGKPSKTIGERIAEGIKKGIDSKLKDVSDSVKNMANSAINTARKMFDEHSPSKVFFEIGKYASIGLANGLLQSLSIVGGASKSVASNSIGILQNATDSLENEINHMSNMATEPIEADVSLGTNISGKEEFNQFMSILNGSMGKVNAALTGLIGEIIAGMETNMPDEALRIMGKDIVQKLMDGFNSRKLWALQTSETFGNDILKKFKEVFVEKDFLIFGENTVNGVDKGIDEKQSVLLKTVEKFCDAIIDEFEAKLNEKAFYSYGEIIVDSINKAIEDRRPKLIETITKMSKEVIERLANELNHDKLYSIGEIIPLAIIQSIENHYNDTYDTTETLALIVTETILDVLEDGEVDIQDRIDTICSIIVNGLTDGINNGLPGVESAISELVETIIENLDKIKDMDLTNYRSLGENIIKSIDDGFNSAQDDLISTIDDLCETLMDEFNELLGTEGMKKLGDDSVTGFKQVLEKLAEAAKTGGSKISEELLGAISPSFLMETMGKIIGGVNEETKELIKHQKELEERAKTGTLTEEDKEDIRGEGSYYTKKYMEEIVRTMFGDKAREKAKEEEQGKPDTDVTKKDRDKAYNDGASIAEAIAKGLSDTIQKAANSKDNPGSTLGDSVTNAAKDSLGIHSPSSVFMEIGRNITAGFVRGIIEPIDSVGSVGNELANKVINPFDEAMSKIDEKLQNDPVITPIMDLSDVKDNMDAIEAMFNRSFVIPATYERAIATSDRVTSKIAPKVEANQEPKETEEKPREVQFIQNNYSPKALSRSEIYRQTKNQFSAFMEVVDAI